MTMVPLVDLAHARSGDKGDTANIGVIAGIVFLAYEIRQNTQVSRAASVQAMADASIQLTLTWGSDEKATALLTRVLAGAVQHGDPVRYW